MNALMDVVFLSRADTDALHRMTQDAIDTCLQGAPAGAVNVIVMEQTAVVYRGAITLPAPEEFAYNTFANRGAREGSAPWIMIANNDLRFTIGWFAALMRAKHPVMSPKDPGRRSQRAITRNRVGPHVGVTFSGWCFVIRRDLWNRIGGFDEDFTFWCADDAVVQQVLRAGVSPMLVPGSRVHHLTSVTHNQTPDPTSDRTWAQVHKFEQKYKQAKFPTNAHYAQWKQENGA